MTSYVRRVFELLNFINHVTVKSGPNAIVHTKEQVFGVVTSLDGSKRTVG